MCLTPALISHFSSLKLMHPEGCWKNLCGESRKTYTCDYVDGFLLLVPAKNGNTHTTSYFCCVLSKE